jgi:hypothetical protein
MTFYIKFIYSEKSTKFCEISTIDLSYVVPIKSTVEILQNFVVFSEYMNFTYTFIGRNVHAEVGRWSKKGKIMSM